mgnify:CR=1 FL=1
MKKRTVWVAASMSLSLSGMAQQVLPKDAAGDKEYARVCKEYEWRSENSIGLLEAYLEKYPDSRHANRVESSSASCFSMIANSRGQRYLNERFSSSVLI